MFLSKLKRLTFLVLGLLTLSGITYASIQLGFLPSVKIVWCVLISILVFVVFVIGVIITEGAMSQRDEKRNSFLVGVVSIFLQHNYKWVYHDELGYFFVSFEKDEISIYDQGFFVSTELFRLGNTGNVKEISSKIKTKLDNLYSEKIIEEKKQKDLANKIETLKKWDGYLDTKSRRDGKINEILK